MRDRKKLRGMKHKIHGKKRIERLGLGAKVAIVVIMIFVSGLLINSLLNQPTTNQTFDLASTPKAAIADHLSLTYPNQTFIQTTTNTLKQAGYTVDYYPGEKVTVEFYRNLPTHNYGVIILRVHAALGENKEPPLALFTSEPYSQTKYTDEQLSDKVASVYFTENKEQRYFGIFPTFVASSMNGKFQNSTIILMGCNGLTYLEMAKAFLEKGAKVYIGWTRSVLGSHTDQATAHLLKRLIAEKTTIEQAVYKTMKEVGPDPTENGLIMYYPIKAGSFTIQSVASNFATVSVEIQSKAYSEKKRNPQPLAKAWAGLTQIQ